MRLHDVVAASAAVAATRSRRAKVAAVAEVLAATGPEEREVVASYLAGSLRQRRTGLGWRGLQELPAPAESATIEVLEVDAAFAALATLAGAGSQAARREAVAALFGRASAEEQTWLRAIATGEVRQGALDAVLLEAAAVAAGVPVASVRRAAMLTGSAVTAVELAFAGAAALDAVRLEVGRPVLPMLASSAPDVAEALTALSPDGEEVLLDAKLDGVRVQAHRRDGDVLLVSRTLEPLTTRMPEVVAAVAALPGGDLVLDGEVLLVGPDGRPRPFQETASRTASAAGAQVSAHWFDLLYLDDADLLETPAGERRRLLVDLLATSPDASPDAHVVAHLVSADHAALQAFADDVLAGGHEGVVAKRLDAGYAAGRRGAAWVKVKPVHTLDLVVLAAEWGSGRRRGWLSNLHLGARDPDGGFVMLGKTFKGLTDQLLAWQTERFLELETHREGHVVHVRPEQVVEIAFDGVQRSTRYPGGVALRFARVLRYRDDKTAAEADSLDGVLAHATWRD